MASNTQLSPRPNRDGMDGMSDLVGNWNPKRRRISIFGPLLLMAIGLIFLLSNLSALPGAGWNLVWTYWPVLLVIAGLDDILRGNYGGAILGMGLGAILLLANLGLLPGWGLWDLLRLWPVFLIIGGVSLLLSGLRSSVASVLGGLLALAVLAAAMFWLQPTIPIGNTSNIVNGQRISQSLEGAKRANITLTSVGRIRVAAMSQSAGLVEGTLDTRNGLRVRRDFSVSGDTATFGLTSEGTSVYFGPNSAMDWNIALNPDVPINLVVKPGVGEADLQIERLNLTQLTVDAGVGRTTITLPDSGQYRAEIKGGVGQIILVIPKGLGARIRANAGLGNTMLPADLIREGDVYLTPNYSKAESQVELQVQQGIGQVVVEMK
jgi:Domain of unknown function (DUF5668)